jgi:hypothetical protein
LLFPKEVTEAPFILKLRYENVFAYTLRWFSLLVIFKEHVELSTHVVGFPCGLAVNQGASA